MGASIRRRVALILGLGAMQALAVVRAQALPDLPVYGDALESGFQDWGWATRDLANTSPVHSGTHSIRFVPSQWQGLYFARNTPLAVQDFEGLRLFVHGGGSGTQQVRVFLGLGNDWADLGTLEGFIGGGAIPANAWGEAWVPFQDVDLPSGEFDGIVLLADVAGSQPAIYVDDLVLVGGEPPLVAPVQVSVNVAGTRRPVSPEIYGVNFGSDAQHAALRYPFRRWGGNRTSRYNFQFDADNTGMDWFFQHIAQGDGSNLPNDSTANRFIDATRVHGGQALVTVPTLGWVARDSRNKAWSYSIAKYGPQTGNECSYFGANPPSWCSADSGNGECVNGSGPNCVGGFIVGNDPLDTSKPAPVQYAADWVTHLHARHGAAAQGGVRYFALDNEPMLWYDTHRDVHPQPAGYDEVWQRGRDRAQAIKAVEPDAVIFGPVTWGWCDFWTSSKDAVLGDCFDGPDRAAHGGTGFVQWYLQQSCATPDSGGGPLVDVLDLHYYPEGVAGLDNDTGAGEAPEVQNRRLRSLRELYDPGWTAESWISQTDYPIVNLIPRARALIQQHCPAMKLAITEYKWGPDDGISGALAQAEALAIFAREGVDYAARWVAPEDGTLAEDAFRMYLDWDGQHARVLGDSVPATTSEPDKVNAYAIDQASGPLFVLLFNHQRQPREVTVTVGGVDRAVRRFRLDANGYAQVPGALAVGGGAIHLAAVPGFSAELLVVERGVPANPDAVFADGFESSQP